MDYLATVIPLVSAFVLAAVGYWKNRPSEDFNKEKFARTIIIGLAVALIQVALNITPGSAEGYITMYLVNTGIIDLIERFLRGIGNRAPAGTLIQRTLG